MATYGAGTDNPALLKNRRVTKVSTGTMVGVSTGLEPYFSFTYYRSGRLGKFIEVKAEIVEEYLTT